MLPAVISLSVLNACFLLVIVLLFYERRNIKKSGVPDLDATALMHDLTHRGTALVRVSRVDPSDYMLISPRDRQ